MQFMSTSEPMIASHMLIIDKYESNNDDGTKILLRNCTIYNLDHDDGNDDDINNN